MVGAPIGGRGQVVGRGAAERGEDLIRVALLGGHLPRLVEQVAGV